jgi:hypothetical protein
MVSLYTLKSCSLPLASYTSMICRLRAIAYADVVGSGWRVGKAKRIPTIVHSDTKCRQSITPSLPCRRSHEVSVPGNGKLSSHSLFCVAFAPVIYVRRDGHRKRLPPICQAVCFASPSRYTVRFLSFASLSQPAAYDICVCDSPVCRLSRSMMTCVFSVCRFFPG